MNKFVKLLFFAIFLIASGVVYQVYYRPPGIGPIKASGNIIEIEMRVKENEWQWNPAEIRIKAGDSVKLKIFNEDNYDHGFAVEAFGINKRLFPRRETQIEFTASRAGSFSFYCSVPCGQGHYDQVGTLFVEE
ncbi:hypothetical protein A2926_00225 [Candidatus Giovannonibacteria bacterium RIFCSPLOWO2_01_FULL_44_40]|uniref:Cytochrome oxidase subunit II copper A binding domain-containing protein n=1 Tax=Candidatus Giovannonibacteria bacterium RIFCSPHIGHO2_01_FULL_45_23 TaxID=1798325 RepID=A0A1F5VFN1_9BACT|nr:MAG: hypothetical protein A2834_01180 [Candidatus Giovannonibacteria bacterium RIFCSPHIGHO2_01_FULL_45_23]OGF75153.1 MAG: hypothetical protein A3C77_01390 [Candidatus Giovannonibacteria bacterium RIFCSPHIGHO2_02_FULL_45_13]OGF79717.1 MAG: hypothetical protein A2926_00225 [Candidatus Giovannonibacteria bacterium RIFCSPLOWO2_01_FULL_44_40]